ncbi:MAG: gliding motility-associated-like protein [Halioglobus sp.]
MYFGLNNILTGNFIKQTPETEILVNAGVDDANPFTSVAKHQSYVINGLDGSIIIDKEILKDPDELDFFNAIGDLDGDNNPEYVIHGTDTLYIFDETLTLKYKQETPNIINRVTNICLADVNGDGFSEIILGTDVYNHMGVLLIDNIESGCPLKITSGECLYSFPVVADITSSPGLEIAAGNKVFELSIVNPNGMIGNTSNVIDFSSDIIDGSTSLADIDGDNQIDIIVVGQGSSSDFFLQVWNPITMTIIADEQMPSQSYSPALIVDLDGDCKVEIVVSLGDAIIAYKYDGTTNLFRWWNSPSDEGPGTIGTTSFDFQGDNFPELCIRDRSSFRILEGTSGATLYEYSMLSTTSVESPVIADIDNDGQAEILIHGYVSEENDSLRLFCFEADDQDWMPTRSVWNQYSYNPTYINEDLTIPKLPQNTLQALPDNDLCQNGECPTPYNNFLSQTTLRTQNGCFVYPNRSIDLELKAMIECSGDSFNLCVKYNLLEGEIPSDPINISLFSRPTGSATYLPLETFEMIGDSICHSIYLDNDIDSIVVVLNYDDVPYPPVFGNGQILECDYENNLIYLNITHSDLTLDLGMDITKCESESITLNAGSGFESYIWSDFSNDSIYNTDLDGLHFVEAKDECGRIYRDSIHIFFDTSIFIDLGEDKQICVDSIVELSVDNSYSVSWFPQENVSCLDCNVIMVVSDTSLTVFVVGEKNGCYTSDSIFIEVNSPVTINIDSLICRGEIFSFKDSMWTDEGTYIYDDHKCDSIFNINLQVLTIDTTKLNWIICQGDSIEFAGDWLKEAGIYFNNENNVLGCDSVISVDLQVDLELFTSDVLRVCQGDSIEVFGDHYLRDTIVSRLYNLGNGCDSIVEITISILPTYLDTIKQNLCFGDSVEINNVIYNVTGEYQLDLIAENGCDSLLFLDLIINEEILSDSTISVCNEDTLIINGYIYYASGIYSVTLDANNGCDSIIMLDLTFGESSNSDETIHICEGDSIMIDEMWYFDGDLLTKTEINSDGCDSIINLIVEHLPTTMIDSMITLCDGDSIFLDGLWYSENEVVSFNGLNSLGCDSTTFFTIELVDILSDQDTISICEGDSLILHGEWQNASGDYPEMFTTGSGCDSVFTYHLIVQDTSVVNLEESICQGDTFFINGQIFMEETFYSFTMLSSTSCDSTVNFTLSVSELPTRLVALSICEGDSVLLDEVWISVEGNYEISALNENGCDSLLTYQITISEYLTSIQDVIRCQGDTVVLNDMTFTSDTILLDTITGVNCPTIRSRHISFAPPSETIMSIEYCQADTFVTSLDTLINTGIAQEIFTSSNGCDSIIIFDVTFIPRSIQNANYSICAGDSIFLSDRYYYEEIMFTDTLAGVQCDSIISYSLSVFDADTSYQEYTIIEGESITINNEEYSTAGEYVQSITNDISCDSILLINIIIEDSTELPVPNVFTPNGDDINDEIIIYMEDYPINELLIFDRWGGLVFRSKNESIIQWNGKVNGSFASEGVYVFKLMYEDSNGDTQTQVGDITLIR